MNSQIDTLLQDLTREYLIFVFPAWGDCMRIFTQDIGNQCVMGLSAEAWEWIMDTHALHTGRPFPTGRNKVQWVGGPSLELYVSTSPVTWFGQTASEPPLTLTDSPDVVRVRIVCPSSKSEG